MISFNSNNLESAYLIVNRLNKSDGASRDINSEILSFQDGFEVISNYWRSRTVVIGGMIDATGSQHLADTIDTLKQNLSGVNKNLDVDYGDGTRRYKGTLSRFNAPEEFYNITHLPYQAEFLCQPFGYATSTQSLTGTDITGATYTDTLTVVGTYPPQPVITITFDSESGASACAFTNTTTGDTITITQAFTAADVLVINCETHKCTLNGTQIDFTGPMPSFVVGSNSLSISVPATARQYDLSIIYTPRYL